MALNQELKGKQYEPISLEVTREHVERFAEAIGEDGTVFRDRDAAVDAGYADQVAPPTFLTTIQIMTSAQVVADPELGLDYSRVVHGEQSYVWHRPVVVGDALTAHPRIADIFAKGPNEFLVIEAEVADAEGEPVGLARTTLLSRGTADRGRP